MIIPYGHSGLKLVRIPWATIAISTLCLLALVLTSGASHRAADTANRLFTEIVEDFTANPGLELDPEILDSVLRAHGVDDNEREVFLEALAERAAQRPRPGAPVTQEEIDRLTERFWTVHRSSPEYRLGLVPDHITPWGLITHQFMHAGWVHLLGNMLFLFIAGPHLEQRWGTTLFVGFYLAAGTVASLFWAVRYLDLDAPLVGASGAIAGLMGAFLICFGTSKIRFFYWFFIIWGTFEAPAWLVLPLWLAKEVVSGRQLDLMNQGVGVAHWAHVWGFIFGMAVAWGLSVLGLDQRQAERQLAASPAAPLDQRRPSPPPPRPAPTTGPTSAELAASIPDVERSPGPTGPPDGRSSPSAAPAGRAEPRAGTKSAVERRPVTRLIVRDGVPSALDGSVLHFVVGRAGHRLDLDRVEAIAVGAVAQPGGRPFVVVDLLLDPPWEPGPDLRVLRLRSSSFDPRTIVGGEQAMDAFTRLLNRLLAASSAVPLPDAAHLRSPGSTTYASLDEYQSAVLGVVGPSRG